MVCIVQARSSLTSPDHPRSDFDDFVAPLQEMLPHMASEVNRRNKNAPGKQQRRDDGTVCTPVVPEAAVCPGGHASDQVASNKKQL
jgi:hypothetical protein